MKYNLSIIHFFLIQISILNLSYCYLIFPFKTRHPPIKENEKNITLIFASLVDNNIYINLDIGEPKQTIEVFLRSDIYDFYISQKPKNNSNQSIISPCIYEVGSDLNKFYDEKKSTTLEISNESIDQYPGLDVGYLSLDYLHFINDKNEKISKQIPFILYPLTMRNTPGAIGLEVPLDEIDKEYNFIDKLKENNIINSYFWMINYTSDYEGNLIIGEQPHIFDPTNYKEEDLCQSYPFLEDTMYGWGLLFDKINFGNFSFKQYHDSFFNYDINYIKGTIELELELDRYFNKSIENGICFKEKLNFFYGPYKFYYCNKDKYKENIKSFPKIEFYQFEFNYTFELDYKDLFIEKDDKIILMIFFDNALYDWILGRPFLKKYLFLMNQDTKIIGFYKKQNHSNDNDNNNNNKKSKDTNKDNYFLLKVILIAIGLIILLILGIVIGKYYFKNTKTHKNIIDEEYDYTAKNEEIN